MQRSSNADEAAVSQDDVSPKMRSRCHLREILHAALVADGRARVDNHVGADGAVGLDDGAGDNHCARTDRSGRIDPRARVHDGCPSVLRMPLGDSLPRHIVSDGNDGRSFLVLKPIVAPLDRCAAELLPPAATVAVEYSDDVPPRCMRRADHDFCVAARANDQQRLHGAPCAGAAASGVLPMNSGMVACPRAFMSEREKAFIAVSNSIFTSRARLS